MRRLWHAVVVAMMASLTVIAQAQSSKDGVTLPETPKLIAGFGAYPLSEAVSSMWFASAPMPKAGMRPALMVYFKGTRGWLDKKVDWKADANADPVFADFRIGEVRLFLQFWPARKLVRLFDQEVSVAEGNVVVATGVDDPKARPAVLAVGAFREVVPDGQNPALYVLAHSPEARRALE
jgi:hypothetical protein